MKNFLKLLLTKSSLLLLIIFATAILIRFFNFSSRVTFWSEQARSLVVSANYIKQKPTLLGQEYFRADSRGHKIFSGAMFNYSLVPMLLLANYDPVIITSFFAILNLVTGFVLYVFVKRMLNKKIAVISLILFLFNDYMVYHSFFIWNYNYLPLIGASTIYVTYLYIKFNKLKYLFLLGIIGGLGVSLQVLYVPIAILVLVVNCYRRGLSIKALVLYIFGLVIGNLPMVVFDFRHDFYHLKTITQYLVDTIAGNSDAGFAYYYFLPFWPAFVIMASFVISKLDKRILLLTIVLYLYINLTSPLISWNTPTGMPKGLLVKDLEAVSTIISNDASTDFNVSQVLDFDKRAYVLRYFITFKNGKKVIGDEEYDKLKLLYVLSLKDYNIKSSDVWEIKSGSPYNITKIADIGNDYALHRLSK